MKNTLSFLLGLFVVSQAIAGTWHVRCEGSKRAEMSFFEHAFDGRPSLLLKLGNDNYNLKGEQISIVHSPEVGGIFVRGSWKNIEVTDQHIRFHMPELSGNRPVHFETDIVVHTTRRFVPSETTLKMKCVANNFVF